MLTPLEIRDTVLSYWHTNYTTTPVEYTNVKFTGDRSQPFVYFSLDFNGSQTVFKGGGTATRHYGSVTVLVRTPVMSGTRQAYAIVNDVCSVLERKRIGDISTRQAIVDDLGNTDEYYNISVEIPFVVT